MQSHTIKRKTENKKKKTVGRGGTRGKTSGRGTKGQNARAGNKKRPEIRDIIKKLPKLRGRGKNSNKPIELKARATVSLEAISAIFKDGAIVSPETLFANKLIKKSGGMFPAVKILSGGNIAKKITVIDCTTSKTALDKIEKAGGSVK